jgi:hypothetical protein
VERIFKISPIIETAVKQRKKVFQILASIFIAKEKTNFDEILNVTE